MKKFRIFLIYPTTEFSISKAPKTFRARKAISKSQTSRLQSCFTHIFLIWTEVLLHTRSFRRIHLSVFRCRWTKNGYTDPKCFRGFRETGPWRRLILTNKLVTTGDEFGTRDDLGKKDALNGEVGLQTNKGPKVHYVIGLLLLPTETMQTISIHREGTDHKKFVQSRRSQNVLHSLIRKSCASNYRRIEHPFFNFRNTGNWWDLHEVSKLWS